MRVVWRQQPEGQYGLSGETETKVVISGSLSRDRAAWISKLTSPPTHHELLLCNSMNSPGALVSSRRNMSFQIQDLLSPQAQGTMAAQLCKLRE